MAILDQQVPNPETVPYSKIAYRTGAYIALFGAIYGLVSYVTGLNEIFVKNQSLNWLNMLFYMGVSFYFCFAALKKHRDQDLGGFLSLGRGVGFGTLSGLVCGVISAVWTFIFMKFIATDMGDTIREGMMEQFEKQGMSEEQIEQALKFSEMFISPGFMAVTIFVMSIIYGLLGGLLAGLFLKREP